VSHYSDPAVKADLLRRLARVEGHVRALRAMIDRDEHCDDVLVQVSAVQGALHRVAGLLLENHVTAYLVEDDAERRSDAIEGLRKTIRQYLR